MAEAAQHAETLRDAAESQLRIPQFVQFDNQIDDESPLDVDTDSDVSTLFPGASGRHLQDLIWERYVVNPDQLLVKPVFLSGNPRGIRTFERHPFNDCRQHGTLFRYAEMVKECGVIRGVRSDCWAVRAAVADTNSDR